MKICMLSVKAVSRQLKKVVTFSHAPLKKAIPVYIYIYIYIFFWLLFCFVLYFGLFIGF